jgi:hypothetical protein
MNDLHNDAQRQSNRPIEDQLELGAEPFWMQDIRIASRAIDVQRSRLLREKLELGDDCEPEAHPAD